MWQWAVAPSGSGVVSAICTDANNHEYITGHFLGSLIFGTDTLNDNAGPYQDIFVAKYDAAGNALWAKNAIGYADAQAISTDATGNIYVLGDFYNDSITFGNEVLTDTTPGNSNIFLVKYDSLGNVLWAKNIGGRANDFAFGVATDLNNNVYVTGYFTGDSLVLESIILHQAGIDNVFLAKYNPSGNALWAKSESCSTYDASSAICTDPAGNVYITGYFSSNKMAFETDTLNSPYLNNVFTTKYDSLGNVRWAAYAGGNNGSSSASIAADAAGNVYVTGYFSDTIALGNNTIAGNGLQNIFTAKYDTGGHIIWAHGTLGTNVDQSTGVTVDGNGNAWVTGYFQSDTISFGSFQLLNPAGNQVTFVTEYSAAGQPVWATAAGGPSNNTSAGISYSNSSIFITGSYEGNDIIFGSDTLSQSSMFIAKLDSFTTTGIAPVSPASDKITVYPNPSTGNFYFNGVAAGNREEIYNLLGQCVCTSIVDRDNYAVNLFGRAKGVYLYRVMDEGKIIQQGKMVVE